LEYLEAMKGKASIYISPNIKQWIEEEKKDMENNKTEEQKELEKPIYIEDFEKAEWLKICKINLARETILMIAEKDISIEQKKKEIHSYFRRISWMVDQAKIVKKLKEKGLYDKVFATLEIDDFGIRLIYEEPDDE